MKPIVSMIAAIGFIAFWSAPAARADDAQQTISQSSSVDQVLDALDTRGKSLNDFTADVRLQEDDEAVGNSTVRTGEIWFQKLPENDARMRLTLDKKIVRGKTFNDKLEYVYANGWLIDRDYGRKTNVRRQVVRPGEKVNLLKLGQGPLPLPLGQDKEDVHQLFDVKKLAPAKNDPANTVHLELTPKPGTKYEHKFDSIDFWIDTASEMPVRIQTTDGSEVRTWDLSNIKLNSGLTDKDFTLPPVNEQEWQLSEEPYGQ